MHVKFFAEAHKKRIDTASYSSAMIYRLAERVGFEPDRTL
jgi:hypothetical protein